MVRLNWPSIVGLSYLAQHAAPALGQSATASRASGTSSAASSSSTAIQTHTVAVGKNGFTYDPDSIQANVGDLIQFVFYPTGHSVVRAEYGYPCIPYEDTGPDKVGFFSGLQNVTQIGSEQATFTVRVNDTSPVFFYCSAQNSCIGYGMVGVINPNSTETLATQKALARNSTIMLQPGEPFPAEATSVMPSFSVPATGTPTSTATSTSSSPASTSAAVHKDSSSALSGGAIAGIVVGGIAVLILAALLFFYVGRSKTLKDVLERKDATVRTTGTGGQDMYPSSPGMYAPVQQQQDYRHSHMSGLPPYHQSPEPQMDVGSPNTPMLSPFGAAHPHNSADYKSELAGSPPPEQQKFPRNRGPVELPAHMP